MTFLFLGLGIILAGGAAAAGLRRTRLGERLYALAVLAGSAIAAVPALAVVLGGTTPEPVRLAGAVAGSPWVFALDPLSAVFLLVFLLVGAAAALYGVSYLRPERAHRPVAVAHLLTAVLLVSLALVVAAQAVVPFLIAWEMMALSTYLLVVFESEKADTRRAGFVYLAVTHAGTLALVLMFVLWGARAPDLTFASLARAAPGLPGGAGGAGVVFALALLGFGVKAGTVPLHFWLPGAHAGAPSHVSALMSGIVIKTGIYGLLRVVSLAGGAPPQWWAWTVLVLGLVSGVLGVVWALAQHDLKRLLAYHSVENIGIILLGIGVGALGQGHGSAPIAVLGYGGALLHVMNHALFKSLLFMGAGAVVRATGTRRMDRMGGLARAMPRTWPTFLVASAAIVGLPPLNGFVSEWVVFQALLGSASGQGALRLAVFGAAGLGLIGALALACFAKVCGVVFLGSPRSADAASARDADAGMLVPMWVLAGLCVAIGLAAPLVVAPALRVGASVAGLGAGAGREAAELVAAPWIAGAAAVLVAVTAALWLLRSSVLRRRPTATAETWACGFETTTPRMQYTASSFAAPLLKVFGPVSSVRVTHDAAGFTTHTRDPVLDATLLPLWARVEAAAARLVPLGRSRLHVSLLLFVATVVVLLVYLAAAGPGP